MFRWNTEKYITFTVPFKKVINDKKSKYKIRISDSYRFMQDSLSNLVDNLSEFKINKIDNDVLIKRFYNTYQLSDNDINKFKLLLRKGVYPYITNNIDCDIVEDAKIYAIKYINIVNDKQVLINALPESIDELMEGLDVDTSNDTATKKNKTLKGL